MAKTRTAWLAAVAAAGFVAFAALPKPGCACRSEIDFVRRSAPALIELQENARLMSGAYPASDAALDSLLFLGVADSAGVPARQRRPLTIVSGGPTGWSAVSHDSTEGWTCGLFVGTATSPAGGTKPGEVDCVGTRRIQLWLYALRH